MEKYVWCEPRKVIEVYGTKAMKERVNKGYIHRAEQAERNGVRDAKKENALKRKWNETDWWQQNDFSPEKLSHHIRSYGCVDVNSFLNYAKKYIRDYTYASFQFSRDQARLEKDINDDLRRNYLLASYWECLEFRRQQFEDKVKEGRLMSVTDTVELIKKLIEKNGYKVEQVVSEVCALLDKTI